MSKKVPCIFGECAQRIHVEDFDETVWLPVFKATREHMGFFCPLHVGELRAGRHSDRYILSQSDQDELIIDRKPIGEEESEAADRSA